MALFPALSPATRAWTPGTYPIGQFRGLSARQRTVRLSNAMTGSSLRLQFQSLATAQLLAIVAHYAGQQGGYLSFGLPSEVWSGVATPSDYSLSNYLWRYAEPPQVEDLPYAGGMVHTVDIRLESVPNEGVVATGAGWAIGCILTPGVAGAANGIQATMAAALTVGGWTLTMPGLTSTMAVGFNQGVPLLDGKLLGGTFAVTATLGAGTADDGAYAPPPAFFDGLAAQVFDWSEMISIDSWGS